MTNTTNGLQHGLSDGLAISGGREIGKSLEEIVVLLYLRRKPNKPSPVADAVCARIERTLNARRAASVAAEK